jgi:hypothetical protein
VRGIRHGHKEQMAKLIRSAKISKADGQSRIERLNQFYRFVSEMAQVEALERERSQRL